MTQGWPNRHSGCWPGYVVGVGPTLAVTLAIQAMVVGLEVGILISVWKPVVRQYPEDMRDSGV
ncbi:hypothetical protein BDW60DRAFT_188854 [Aspergillus nidulans var. acristatus]|jgi:hypothetical protein